MALIKKWCLRAESNHRHGDFQSPALPTELQRRFYSACLVYYIPLEMSTTFFKIFVYSASRRKQSQKLSLRLYHFSLPFYGGFVPTTSPPLYPFMREQPHGAAKNSSTETRLLYVCLVIYTVCRLPCHLKCRIVFSENLVIGRHGSQQASL